MKKQLAGFFWLVAIMGLFMISGHNKDELQVQMIETEQSQTEMASSVQGIINLSGK